MGSSPLAASAAGRQTEHIANCGSGYLVGSIGSVVFSVTNVGQPMESYDASEKLMASMHERYPDGFMQPGIGAFGGVQLSF